MEGMRALRRSHDQRMKARARWMMRRWSGHLFPGPLKRVLGHCRRRCRRYRRTGRCNASTADRCLPWAFQFTGIRL